MIFVSFKRKKRVKSVLENKKSKKSKNTEVQRKDHPINICANYLCSNMNDANKHYWNYNAQKKKISLQKMVESYLINDFGVRDTNFKYTDG